MNKVLLVFKIMVIEELGLHSLKKKLSDRDFSFSEVIAVAFFFIFLIVAVYFLGPLYYRLFLVFAHLGVPDLFLTMVIFLVVLSILFICLQNMISGFYGGDFSKHLVTFPLHAYQLFGAYMLKELIFKIGNKVLILVWIEKYSNKVVKNKGFLLFLSNLEIRVFLKEVLYENKTATKYNWEN